DSNSSDRITAARLAVVAFLEVVVIAILLQVSRCQERCGGAGGRHEETPIDCWWLRDRWRSRLRRVVSATAPWTRASGSVGLAGGRLPVGRGIAPIVKRDILHLVPMDTFKAAVVAAVLVRVRAA